MLQNYYYYYYLLIDYLLIMNELIMKEYICQELLLVKIQDNEMKLSLALQFHYISLHKLHGNCFRVSLPMDS